MKLLIKAFTGSEWDNANLIVVDINKEVLDTIKNYIKLTKSVRDIDWFATVTFWHEFDVFDDSDEANPFDETKDWKVVSEITEMSLLEPEQVMSEHQIALYNYGFGFKCWGKHTGEEFWSGIIPYESLNKISKLVTT